MKIRVQPGARKNEIVGPHADSLKIKIAAPPEDGRANAELCSFLADLLGVAKSKISVVKGHSSRNKIIAIEGMSEELIKAKFGF
jgi:uncharacterized protein (TIGR00251 family)